MADKLWKATERAIAERLGGERVPITGRQRGSAPDIEHEEYALEVKQRKTIPQWLTEALEQADAAMKQCGPEKTPVVVIHEKNKRYRDDIVMMRMWAFERLTGEDQTIPQRESEDV